MGYTLDELKRDATDRRAKQNKWLRDNYRLAKSLGFSPAESTVLAPKGEQVIRELARQRETENAGQSD